MMDYEPTNLDRDISHLKNQLTEVALLAGRLVSNAALEGNEPITEMFDKVAQRLTFILLELQAAAKEIADANNEVSGGSSDG